jgi:hypothetical protein
LLLQETDHGGDEFQVVHSHDADRLEADGITVDVSLERAWLRTVRTRTAGPRSAYMPK